MLKISSRERDTAGKKRAFFFPVEFEYFPSVDFDLSGCFGKSRRCSFQKNRNFGFSSTQKFLACRLRGKGKFLCLKSGFCYENPPIGYDNPPSTCGPELCGDLQRVLRYPALAGGACSTSFANLWQLSKAENCFMYFACPALGWRSLRNSSR